MRTSDEPTENPNFDHVRTNRNWRNARFWFSIVLLGSLFLVPMLSDMGGEDYYTSLFSRIVILALAATGVGLIISFCGMLSFGHSLYVGLGAYAVGMLSEYGVTSGYLQIVIVLSACVLVAVPVGAICLRTRGMAFIMITLAFAQMAYSLAIGLQAFGGEDGFQLAKRSDFYLFRFDSDASIYYASLTVLVITLALIARLVHSRFGVIIRAAKSNEDRLSALGVPAFRYKLTAYVISAVMCAVSGFLLANATRFISPSYLYWIMSGDLIVMAVLGGLGTIVGPVVGALVVILIETLLSGLDLGLPPAIESFVSSHWLAFLGAVILCVSLFLRQGLVGWIPGARQESKP